MGRDRSRDPNAEFAPLQPNDDLSMKVLVTFAVEAEFAPWRELRHFERLARADMDCYSVQIGDAEVKVLLTGIGGKKCWVEATKILWDADIDVCISSGFAGALKPEHRPGEVLAAELVHATEWKTVVPSDSVLLELAASCGAKIVRAFYSADHVVLRAAEKRELGLKADAVEMESGEVLYEAAAFGAKGIAIRGISDAAEEDLPLDFNRVVTDSGDVSVKRVLGQVLRNPRAVPSLIRFGQQSRLAGGKLAEFLDRYLQKVALAKAPWLANGVSSA
jgi:adenosylhomocysteine nucleosidase